MLAVFWEYVDWKVATPSGSVKWPSLVKVVLVTGAVVFVMTRWA